MSRESPSLSVEPFDLGALKTACANCNLREICAMPGMDRTRAMRLLNALYLQAGLIVSRTHPVATNDSWFGSSRN